MQKSKEFWILNGILFTQNETRAVLRAHLRIKDGKIDAITSKRPKKTSKSVRYIDASGLTILPGFVQAHIHLCQSLFRNQADDLELLDWLSKKIWIMEAAHTEETIYTSALLGIHELLSSGSTCILDMGTVRHTPVILEAVRDTGIRASVGKCLMDHPEQTPPYLRETTEKALQEATELYEKWHGKENDRIRISYAPRFAVSCTEALLKEVSRLSNQNGALIHTHSSENIKEVELVRKMTGQENIEYFHQLGLTSPRLVLAHCIWLNSQEKETLRKSGTHVVHCPSSNLKLASGISPVPELRGLGINVALGADGTPCNNNLNMFQEMRLAALIHKPGRGPTTLKAMEAIDMATRDGARALNWLDQIGTIEEGKKADLIAIDLTTPTNTVYEPDSLNPKAIASSIVYSSNPTHLKWTMIDGKIVYQNGKVLNVPTDNLVQRVRKAQKIILK